MIGIIVLQLQTDSCLAYKLITQLSAKECQNTTYNVKLWNNVTDVDIPVNMVHSQGGIYALKMS